MFNKNMYKICKPNKWLNTEESKTLNKGRDILCSWVRRFTVAKELLNSQFILWVQINPNKNLRIFGIYWQADSKICMERQNNSEKNKTGRFILSDFNAGKAPVIKDNMVLAG